MPGQDLLDAIEAVRARAGPTQLEELFRVARMYSADDRACRDVLDRLTQTHRAEVAKAWAAHHADRVRGVVAGARWHAGPTIASWYVVHRSNGGVADLALIRFESGECFTETGAPCGAPDTVEFEGARWLGPVERP